MIVPFLFVLRLKPWLKIYPEDVYFQNSKADPAHATSVPPKTRKGGRRYSRSEVSAITARGLIPISVAAMPVLAYFIATSASQLPKVDPNKLANSTICSASCELRSWLMTKRVHRNKSTIQPMQPPQGSRPKRCHLTN